MSDSQDPTTSLIYAPPPAREEVTRSTTAREANKPPPPYRPIASLLKQGKVVPFLGSGINFIQRPDDGVTWSEESHDFLPNGSELSKFLASRCSFPSKEATDLDDLAKVAAYYEELNGRPALYEDLRLVFDRNLPESDIHRYLAEVAATTPLLIVTTNYDVLTEQAFKNAGVPYHLIIHPTELAANAGSVLWWAPGADEPRPITPQRLLIDLNTSNVIYKMHGTVDRLSNKWNSYVITEDDYVDFLSQMTKKAAVPRQFLRHFRERQFLFLGYALRDWNLRVVLRNLTGGASRRNRSWAIQHGPSDLEVALWRARDVTIFDVSIKEFVEQLRAASRGL